MRKTSILQILMTFLSAYIRGSPRGTEESAWTDGFPPLAPDPTYSASRTIGGIKLKAAFIGD